MTSDKVTNNDIEACHRISKKNNRINSTKIIIRFVNRKHAKKALFNKNKLSQNHKNYSLNTSNNTLFISENLTRMNGSLAYQGRKLKRSNLVNACYKWSLQSHKRLPHEWFVGPLSRFRFWWWWTFPRCISWCISSVYLLRWVWLLLTCWVINIMARKLGLCPLTWITLLTFSVLIFCAFNLLFQNLEQ